MLGLTLALLGDINEDGLPDIGIGANGATRGVPEKFHTGISYIVSGNRFFQSNEEDLSPASQQGNLKGLLSIFNGDLALDRSGFALAGGDIDDDGQSDLIVSARGYSEGLSTYVGKVHLVNGQDLGSVAWPHTQVTGNGFIGQNMSYTPYLDAWGNFSAGYASGFKFGVQVDPSWSLSALPAPVFMGFMFVGLQINNPVIYPNGFPYKNIGIWPQIYITLNFPVLSNTGSWVQEAFIPSTVPSGATFYIQQVWLNPNNKKNLAATNCRSITVK